jgi:LmbE family N-acetylglucosaminyl deacetylase
VLRTTLAAVRERELEEAAGAAGVDVDHLVLQEAVACRLDAARTARARRSYSASLRSSWRSGAEARSIIAPCRGATAV